jgi:peptide/nickel transport system ATP-binding protein
MSLVHVEALSAVSTRDRTPILRDVSLTLERGEVRGLVGESGAGKSTLGKALLGILPATIKVTGGWLRFEDRDLLTLPAAELRRLRGREITLIPQDPQTALNPARTIAAQLGDVLRMKLGLRGAAQRARALELLEEVQIRDPARVLASYPHQLSGGMRQRVLIASAFAPGPKLVVADEPTTALDVTVQKEILRLIRRMQERHGTAAIFVTHDLGVVAKICDSVTLLYAGKVVEAGSAADLFSNPREPYTRALLTAGPRYDQPGHGLEPVPDAVLEPLRADYQASLWHG